MMKKYKPKLCKDCKHSEGIDTQSNGSMAMICAKIGLRRPISNKQQGETISEFRHGCFEKKPEEIILEVKPGIWGVLVNLKKLWRKIIGIVKEYSFIFVIIGVIIAAATFYSTKPEVLLDEYGYNEDRSEYIFKVKNFGKTSASDVVLSVYYLYRPSFCPDIARSGHNYDGVHELPQGETVPYLVPLFPLDLYKNIMDEDLCKKELKDKIKSEGLLTRLDLSYKWAILPLKWTTLSFKKEYTGLLKDSGFQLY